MRQLHELLWYLNEARSLAAATSTRGAIDPAFSQTEELTNASADTLMYLDIDAHRDFVNAILTQASELARASIATPPEFRGAKLVGADLAQKDLRGASFRGAALIGANLAGADL